MAIMRFVSELFNPAKKYERERQEEKTWEEAKWARVGIESKRRGVYRQLSLARSELTRMVASKIDTTERALQIRRVGQLAAMNARLESGEDVGLEESAGGYTVKDMVELYSNHVMNMHDTLSRQCGMRD